MWTLVVTVPVDAAGLFLAALDPLCMAVATEELPGGREWRVIGYSEAEPDAAAAHEALALAAATTGVAVPALAMAVLPERDWLAENRSDFPTLRVGRFFIHRSHHDAPPRDGRIAIRLDASLAFGSGTHATTQGCLMALEGIARRRAPGTVLDLGTGSGILAIAAAKLWPGRAKVAATDIDPVAVRFARNNAAANGVGARLSFAAGTGLRPVPRRPRRFDVILANIQLRPLAALAPGLAARVAPGGDLILSGLLAGDEPEALAVYAAQGLALARRIPLAGWITLVMHRRQRRPAVRDRRAHDPLSSRRKRAVASVGPRYRR